MTLELWISFLRAINDLQVFELCERFDELSLSSTNSSSSVASEDQQGSSSSSSSYSYSSSQSLHRRMLPLSRVRRQPSILQNFMRRCNPPLSPLCRSLINEHQAPYIDIPRSLLDSLSNRAHNLQMFISFRFLPGQFEFLTRELRLPPTSERITFLSQSLGLSVNRTRLHSLEMLSHFSRSGVGLRSMVPSIHTWNVLVDVYTYQNGIFGRFITSVWLGLGCTVWYTYVPGTLGEGGIDTNMILPVLDFLPFLNMEYDAPGFTRIHFVESQNVEATVASALRNDQPFCGADIPANGPMLTAIGLAVVVSLFLAVGLVPDTCGNS